MLVKAAGSCEGGLRSWWDSGKKSGRKRCFPEEIAYAVLFCSYGGNYDCSVPESPSPLFSRYGSVLYAVPFPGAGPCVFKRDLQEILPEHQEGFRGSSAFDQISGGFYLGCGGTGCNGVPGGQPEPWLPVWDSGGKGKGGAGMLEDLEFLERFWIRFFLHVRHFTFRLKPGWGFPARILFPSFWSCTTGTRFGS